VIASWLCLRTGLAAASRDVGVGVTALLALVFDLLTILAFFIVIWNLSTSAPIPAWVVKLLVLVFLFVVVPARLLARLTGGMLDHLIRLSFTIGMPLVSFLVLYLCYGRGDPLVITLLTTIFLMLLGIYLVFWGAFSKPHGLLWSLPIVVSIFTFVIGLALRGRIPPQVAAFSLAGLVLIAGAANLLSSEERRTVRRTLSSGLAITVLLLMLLSGGREFASSVLALIILFGVFWWFFRGLLGFGKR
jgi:hypothetical protein